MATAAAPCALAAQCPCTSFDLRCRACTRPLFPALDPADATDQKLLVTIEIFCSVLRRMAALKGFDMKGRAAEFATQRDEARGVLLATFDGYFAAESAEAALILERQHYRQKVLAELCSTEEDYLKDLRLMHTIWEPELARAAVVGPQEMAMLFATIPRLITLSEEFHRLLREARALPVAQQAIGKEFRAMVPFINVYIEYCASQMQQTELLSSIARNSRLRDALERIRVSSPELRKLDLASFVAKPLQRVTKYPLFFRDLIKNTELDHPDYRELEAVEKALDSVLKKINTRTRERETMILLNKLQPSLVWRTSGIDLMLSKSEALKHDALKCVVNAKDCSSASTPPPCAPAAAPPASSGGTPASSNANGTASEAPGSPASSAAAAAAAAPAPAPVPVPAEGPRELDKGNWAGLFNNVLLVCRTLRERYYEVAALPTQGMAVCDGPDDSIVVTHAERPEEVVLYPRSFGEKLLWSNALSDALQVSEEPAVAAAAAAAAAAAEEQQSPSFIRKLLSTGSVRRAEDDRRLSRSSIYTLSASVATAEFMDAARRREQTVTPATASPPQAAAPAGGHGREHSTTCAHTHAAAKEMARTHRLSSRKHRRSRSFDALCGRGESKAPPPSYEESQAATGEEARKAALVAAAFGGKKRSKEARGAAVFVPDPSVLARTTSEKELPLMRARARQLVTPDKATLARQPSADSAVFAQHRAHEPAAAPPERLSCPEPQPAAAAAGGPGEEATPLEQRGEEEGQLCEPPEAETLAATIGKPPARPPPKPESSTSPAPPEQTTSAPSTPQCPRAATARLSGGGVGGATAAAVAEDSLGAAARTAVADAKETANAQAQTHESGGQAPPCPAPPAAPPVPSTPVPRAAMESSAEQCKDKESAGEHPAAEASGHKKAEERGTKAPSGPSGRPLPSLPQRRPQQPPAKPTCPPPPAVAAK
eukprot:m51a1_g4864 hypothetical protein (943) ;mRNA; f:330125-334537